MTETRNANKTCRNCSQPVVWATNHNGKSVLLDAEPIDSGDIVLSHLEPGGEMNVRNVRRDEEFSSDVPRYTCHFLTCPKAEPREDRPKKVHQKRIDIPEYEGERERSRRGDRSNRRPRVGDSRR